MLGEKFSPPQAETGAKEPAEVLFDKIMADVRVAKGNSDVADVLFNGKEINFKNHPEYSDWKNLRNQNFERSATPEQIGRAKEKQMKAESDKQKTFEEGTRLRAEQTRKIAENRVSAELSRIAREQADQERLQEIYYKQRESARAELTKEIEGLVGSMTENLSNFRNKATELQGLSVLRFIRKGELKNELEELIKDTKALFEVLKGKVKMSDSKSDDRTSQAQALVRQMEALDRAFSDTTAKDAIISGNNKWATGLIVLMANLPGIFAHAQSTGEKLEERGGRVEIAVSDDTSKKEEVTDLNFVSDRVESQVAGLSAPATPDKVSSAEVDDGSRTYTVADTHSFQEWQGGIVKATGTKFDKQKHTESLAIVPNVGSTAELIDQNGQVLSTVKIKKGGSVWGAIDKMKPLVDKGIAEEKKLSLRLKSFKDAVPGKEGTVYESTPGLILGRGADKKSEKDHTVKLGKPAGNFVERNRKNNGKPAGKAEGPAVSNPELEAAARAEVAPKLVERGVKHNLGSDYSDTVGYDDAIAEMDTLQKGDSDLDVRNAAKTEINRLKLQREALAKRLEKYKDAAGKFLKGKGEKHQPGQDYKTVPEFQTAIDRLKAIYDSMEEVIAIDGKFKSAEDEEKFSAEMGLQREIERLRKAKDALDLLNKEAQYRKEDKVPPAAPPEKIKFESKPRISNLASEADLRLLGGVYEDRLFEASRLIIGVEYFSSRAKGDPQVEKFSNDAKAAMVAYENLLKPGIIDLDTPSGRFAKKQALLGLTIAKDQVVYLAYSLPEKKAKEIKNIIDAVKIQVETLIEKYKDKNGNSAIFDNDHGAIRIVYSVVQNTVNNGKVSNSDKKVLNKVKRTIHTVLHGSNSSKNDLSAAKDLLDITNALSGTLSHKDQDNTDIDEDKKDSFSGVHYQIPGLSDQETAKNLQKLLPGDIQKRIGDIYELTANLADASPASTVAADLVSASSLLEQLVIRPLEVGDIQEKLNRAEALIVKVQTVVQKGTIFPKEYAVALSQLDSTVKDTKDSLAKIGLLDKEAPAKLTGKRVADGR